MILTAAHVRAIEEWEHAEAWRAWAVANEFEKREALQRLFFPNPFEGTNNAELGDGMKIKAVFKNRYVFRDTDTHKVREVAKALPPAVADPLFKWKAEPSISQYRKLEPAHRTIVNEVLTIIPDKPSIEIIRG